MAGINASLFAQGKPLCSLSRSSSFIGTMIDDLCTKELKEPYRVLTSRSEYRLLLRADNADERLVPLGRELGLVDDYCWKLYRDKYDRIRKEMQRLSDVRVKCNDCLAQQLEKETDIKIHSSQTLSELLKRPGFHYHHLKQYGWDSKELANLFEEESVETRIKYSGYLHRQEEEIRKLAKSMNTTIPVDMDYTRMTAMRKEAIEKLCQFRPCTIGQASRLSGVNPTDISILLVYLERQKRMSSSDNNNDQHHQDASCRERNCESMVHNNS